MAMHSYTGHAYIVTDDDSAVVADLGPYTIIIQSYTGTTYSGRDRELWLSYLQNGLASYSFFGGTVIATQAFDPAFFLQFYPVINVLRVPQNISSTDRLKIVFPNGYYLLGASTLSASSGGRTMRGYDPNGNYYPSSSTFYIPGCENNFTNPDYTFNVPIYRFIAPQYFTDTGFDLSYTSISDFECDTTTASNYCYITSRQNRPLYAFLNRLTPDRPIVPSDDPFSPGGTSEPGGGDGTFGENRFGDGIDDESITVPDYDPLDQLNRSVLGSQFVNVYAPSQANIGALKGFLWSSQIGDTLKKMFNNPMDAIISLHMVPVTVPGITQNIFLGGTDTEIESTRVSNQYVTVNCGTMTIGEYWDAYLDYSPYTKLFLYLPFCGMHEVDVDEFMGQSISIRYDVDVVSGDCLCSISAARSGGMSTVLYQYAGNCSVEIPVSMANYNARISAYLGLVGSAAGVAAGIASGGLSAPLAASAIASTAANVASAKTTIQRSGAIAGSTAWMSQLKPYLILVQPTQCLPDNQAHFTGYPSFITASVGDLSGFTSFAEIHLEGISATDTEKAEIESILKGGVLL